MRDLPTEACLLKASPCSTTVDFISRQDGLELRDLQPRLQSPCRWYDRSISFIYRFPSADNSSGTTKGFRIYTTEPFAKCFESRHGDVGLLEMLFSTSLVAVVVSPRTLEITNPKVCTTRGRISMRPADAGTVSIPLLERLQALTAGSVNRQYASSRFLRRSLLSV